MTLNEAKQELLRANAGASLGGDNALAHAIRALALAIYIKAQTQGRAA